MKKRYKRFCVLLFMLAFSLIAMMCYAYSNLQTKYKADDINNLEMPFAVSFNIEENACETVSREFQKQSYNVVFKLFGVFPIKEASVSVQNRSYVNVLGKPFGIKLYTDGVLIINLSAFPTKYGKICPASDSGLKSGDYIISINDVNVFTNSQVEKIVESVGEGPLEVVYSRNNSVFKTTVQPVLSSEDNKYHLGMWVRDSSAGVGTLTFYSSENKILAGLGHPLCDSDTGEMISINKGSLVEAEILSVAKSKKGRAGELLGRFKFSEYSKAITNSPNGIYSVCEQQVKENLYPVAFNFEISEGEAEILTTIDGGEPKSYSCEVLKIIDDEGNKNFLIKITDQNLISKAGGIVQGMSGSPIIQNGKLIGAVTHVLVDDTTKGYAIFAENMLETAQSVEQNNNLKDAS